MRELLPHRPARLAALGGIALLAAGGARAQGEEDAPDALDRDYGPELPRVPPREPDEALAAFHLRPGFRVELAAAEPLVRDPVAIAFDEDGRLFVVEMRGYSERRGERLGAVRLLEDTDGDGRFDVSHVFAEHLAWPTAVACWAGGVFVVDAPDVWYLADTDGDGRADRRERVFTGFGTGNVQGLANSLRWGPDQRIHGAGSLNGGEVVPVAAVGAPPVSVRGRDFAFDPRAPGALSATSGGAQHGLAFDDFGRKLVTSNSDHVQLVMFEDRYAARSPFLGAPSARLSIAADGPQADVFRASPLESWRVVRTRLRVKGIVGGPVEGGGTPAGYFTGATGLEVYRGDAFPTEFRGNVFVCDVGSNLVHRKTLAPDAMGPALVARRAEPRAEFLASEDVWFRPVEVRNGPDGALWIVDMYREVIEHPLSLPPLIKRHLDLDSGRDRGRIWRVVPDGFERRPGPALSARSVLELALLLDHPNAWHAETAARLLSERWDDAATARLAEIAADGERAAGRARALAVLADRSLLDEATLLRALADEDPRVRERALRLAERFAGSERVDAAVRRSAGDPDPRVRYQLAFSLGELGEMGEATRLSVAPVLARRDFRDRWMRFALLSSLSVGAGRVLAELDRDEELRRSGEGRALLAGLALAAGASGLAADVEPALTLAEELADSETELAGVLLERLVEGAERAGGARELLGRSAVGARLVRERWSAARTRAADPRAAPDARARAVRALGLAPFEEVRDVLAGALAPREPAEVQLAALATFARFPDDEVGAVVVAAWRSLGPTARAEAAELLLAREAWTLALLDALESGAVRASQLDSTRVELLLAHAAEPIRRRAGELFEGRSADRVAAAFEALRPALALDGDASAGEALFLERCASCHRRGGAGHDAGPDLSAVVDKGAESVLLAIVDPGREIHPQYVDYLVRTTDGRLHTGILAEESSASLTLVRAGGVRESLLRVHVDEVRSSDLSLMPEGLLDDLEPEAVAGLLAFLLGEGE